MKDKSDVRVKPVGGKKEIQKDGVKQGDMTQLSLFWDVSTRLPVFVDSLRLMNKTHVRYRFVDAFFF